MNPVERTRAVKALRAAAARLTANVAYRLELEPREYAALEFLYARGYDGGLIDNATEIDESSTGVTLSFRESDAWAVREAYDDDPDAYGATAPRSLLRKMIDFVDEIV